MALLDSSGNAVKSAAGSIFNAFSPSASPISKPSAYSYGTNQGSGVVNSLTEGSKTQYPVGFNKNSVNQAPSSALGMLGAFLSPTASAAKSVGKTFLNQVNYGMNDEAAANYTNLVNDPANAGMSAAQLVQMAREPQMNRQLPQAMNSKQRSAAGLPDLPRGNEGMMARSMGPESLYGQGPSAGGGATIPDGTGNTSTFKPITFRSGAGTSVLDESGLSTSLGEDYAGLAGLVGEGTGLMGEAAGMAQQAPEQFNYNFNPEQAQGLLNQANAQAQQAPDQFNYNFNPEQAGQDLFNQRAALLQPQFAQQTALNNESMFGGGRLGLRLAGEGVGAGSGMVQPDAFGVNQAQSQALANLAAQSTNDAFGQQVQQAGLDLSQFGTNQGLQQQQYANLMGSGQNMFSNQLQQSGLDMNQYMANQAAQQQQYANLMGSGTGMLSAGMGGAALENQLAGTPMTLAGLGQQQQGLDQDYEMGNYQNETQRMLADAQIAQGNVQDNGWLTGLTSLGSSFLGTNAGGDWLSNGFSKGGWFS